MKPIYIRELEHYSKEYLVDLMDENIFEKLLNSKIIKNETDINQYSFHYVGVIIIDEMVIKCYPKYIHNTDNIQHDFQKVINVIKKYNSSKEYITYEDIEKDDVSSNLLPILLFFIEDYYENGVYTRVRNIFEKNGNGEIDWNKTVNNNLAIIKDNEAFYTQLDTKYKINDVYDYFKLLHEYIITECSKYLEKVGLLELFDLTPIEISEKTLDDFGELEIILDKIRKELNIEFNTRKQKLLKVMYYYLSNKNLFNENNSLRIYGTSSYHEIWEKVCKIVFQDKLDKESSKLHLPVKLKNKYSPNDPLINVIKKPVWNLTDYSKETDTFIPDIVTFYKDSFLIFDAKYYDLRLNNGINGQPGLESISKQYLYELSFKEFIKDHEFKNVKNAFLFPTENLTLDNRGYVTLEILKRLNLQDIQIIMLPANLIYDYYLKNKKMDILDLKLE